MSWAWAMPEDIETRGWSQGLLSFGINEPRTRKDNSKPMVVSKELSFLGKASRESIVEGRNPATSGMLYKR